ncbi:MAG: F0F1 ATP synthase subunit gamma [Gammaproteobacteria bacterium]|nr:F0F1 ATP synthase subunit gamma [Gammaproteobacteria bacterium]
MRLAEIERHVASMEELQRIVGAMRAIASMRMQEAVRALLSVRAYGGALAEAVNDALAIAREEAHAACGGRGGWFDAARTSAQRRGRRAIVVFGSEHGFVGGFNRRLLEAVESDLTAADALMIVGCRGAAFAAERGHEAAWVHPLATRLAGIADTVRLLEEGLLPRITHDEVVRVEVVFSRHLGSGELAIERRRLFPLQLGVARREGGGLAPLHDLPATELLERLTAGYMLAQLTEAATEALAAENAARFAAMESARDNVGRKLEALRLDASRARQEEVTTELLDLVTGQEAVDHT